MVNTIVHKHRQTPNSEALAVTICGLLVCQARDEGGKGVQLGGDITMVR